MNPNQGLSMVSEPAMAHKQDSTAMEAERISALESQLSRITSLIHDLREDFLLTRQQFMEFEKKDDERQTQLCTILQPKQSGGSNGNNGVPESPRSKSRDQPSSPQMMGKSDIDPVKMTYKSLERVIQVVETSTEYLDLVERPHKPSGFFVEQMVCDYPDKALDGERSPKAPITLPASRERGIRVVERCYKVRKRKMSIGFQIEVSGDDDSKLNRTVGRATRSLCLNPCKMKKRDSDKKQATQRRLLKACKIYGMFCGSMLKNKKSEILHYKGSMADTGQRRDSHEYGWKSKDLTNLRDQDHLLMEIEVKDLRVKDDLASGDGDDSSLCLSMLFGNCKEVLDYVGCKETKLKRWLYCFEELNHSMELYVWDPGQAEAAKKLLEFLKSVHSKKILVNGVETETLEQEPSDGYFSGLAIEVCVADTGWERGIGLSGFSNQGKISEHNLSLGNDIKVQDADGDKEYLWRFCNSEVEITLRKNDDEMSLVDYLELDSYLLEIVGYKYQSQNVKEILRSMKTLSGKPLPEFGLANQVWKPGGITSETLDVERSLLATLHMNSWLTETSDLSAKESDNSALYVVVLSVTRRLGSRKTFASYGEVITVSVFGFLSLEDKAVLLPGRKLKLYGQKMVKRQHNDKNMPLLLSVLTHGTFQSPGPPESLGIHEDNVYKYESVGAGELDQSVLRNQGKIKLQQVQFLFFSKLGKELVGVASKLELGHVVSRKEMRIYYATGECGIDDLKEAMKVEESGNSWQSSKKLICRSKESVACELEEASVLDKRTPTTYSTLMHKWLHHKVLKRDIEVNLGIKGDSRDGKRELQEKMTSMISIFKLINTQATDMMEFFLYEVFHFLRPPEQLISVLCRLLIGSRYRLTKQRFLTQRPRLQEWLSSWPT